LKTSKPAVFMSIAESIMRFRTSDALSSAFACSISAATPAASGAAAEVPKKWLRPPATLVVIPSGAVRSTFDRNCGVTSRLPLLSNRSSASPYEEKYSSCGGVTPNFGVCV
jgi:hypothetical protein